MLELSWYSVRSLSETKHSDRTRKWPITFCLEGKLAFTSSRFPILIIIYPLSALFHSQFFCFVTVTSVCLSHRGLLPVMETLQNLCTFPES